MMYLNRLELSPLTISPDVCNCAFVKRLCDNPEKQTLLVLPPRPRPQIVVVRPHRATNIGDMFSCQILSLLLPSLLLGDLILRS